MTSRIEVEGNVDLTKIGTYTVTYKVIDSDGNAAYLKRNVTVNPGKVKSLKVSSRETNSLILAWTKQSGASGYKIYQYDSKGKLLKTITTSTNSYKVRQLTNANNLSI